MSGSDDDDDEEDASRGLTKAKRHAWSEGQKTIEHQTEKIHQEDDKAIGITRLNILVLGILTSGISLSIRSDRVLASNFLNTHVVLGVASLVVSTIVASMAYTSSSFEMGLGAKPMRDLAEGNISAEKYFEKLGEEYPTWVEKNHEVHRFNSYAITWALIFSIAGFTLLIGGLSVGATGYRGHGMSYILLVVEIGAILILGVLVYYSDLVFNKTMNFRDNGF